MGCGVLGVGSVVSHSLSMAPQDTDTGGGTGAPPDQTLHEVHQALSRVASLQNCSHSVVNGRVSAHTFASGTASFKNLTQLYNTVKEQSRRARQVPFIGSLCEKLVFTSRIMADTAPAAPAAGSTSSTSSVSMDTMPPKKRQRRSECDRFVDRLDEIHERLKTLRKVPEEELECGVGVMRNVIQNVRGSQNEVVAESFALLARKLDPSDDRARVVLAVRFVAGVAIPLAALKRALGPCWTGGCVTVTMDACGIGEADLPLGAAAKAAESLGNRSVLLVTAVPVSPPE